MTTNQMMATNAIAAASRHQNGAGTVPALMSTKASPASAPMTDPMGLFLIQRVYTTGTERAPARCGTRVRPWHDPSP